LIDRALCRTALDDLQRRGLVHHGRTDAEIVEPAFGVEVGGRRDDALVAIDAAHEQLHGPVAVQGHLDGEVLERVHRLARDGQHTFAAREAGLPGRAAGIHRAGDRREDRHAGVEYEREHDEREQRVHEHATRPEQRALAQRLAVQRFVPRITLVGGILAGDHHVAAERHERQSEVGAIPGHAAQARAEAEREHLDAHPGGTRGQEVAELVDEDQEADAQSGQEDAA
jgi:hypothetical protein